MSAPTRSSETEFYFSDEKEPHRARTKEILKKYPEIRQLIGKKQPWSFVVAVVAVAAQFGMAFAMSSQPWYIALAAAFLVGTVINHCFIGLVHDLSHNLVFRNKTLNSLTGLLVNSAMFIPSFVSFQKYHMKHHAFQGIYELDADIPSRWEAKFVRNIWWRKMLWLLFYPLIQSLRTGRVREVAFMDFWVVANMIATFAADIAVFYFWGVSSFVYLAGAMWLGFGLSAVGGQLIQEHYVVDAPQETYSYYGWLSLPSLHVGHHNEHHDFPSAPWSNLPKIRKIAAEYYDNMTYHTSWGKLVLRFIFSPKISLYDRVERQDRGGLKLDDAVEADLVAIGQKVA